MSLIGDTDFLIHSLRLSYLRHVDDPYGPRVISLDPAYTANPYVLAASLADHDRWPQLALPASPNLSEDEGEKPLGGAKLKYTTTIMGGRSGGAGLRVNGKRQSTSSKRLSGTPRQADMKNFIQKEAPVSESLPSKSIAQSIPADPWINVNETQKQGSPEPTVEVHQATAPEEVPVAKVVQFIPKFRGAAEMEARRRVRMAARRGLRGPMPAPAKQQNLSFDSSDEDEPEPAATTEVSSSDEDEPVAVDAMDDVDEFDPEFAATRTAATSDSASDGVSVFSAGTGSMPTSAGIPSSQNANAKLRPRLSPVSEHTSRQRQPSTSKADSAKRPAISNPNSGGSNPVSATSAVSPPAQPDNLFVRRKVVPIAAKPLKSTLSAMLASSSSSSNPFSEMYAAISGRGEGAATNVQVYFPHARSPAGKAMDLNVRKDATVEEVIGFALWSYWEEDWSPKLTDGITETDPKWQIKLSAVGWILRIAEEDGEVDDDFPPPDRMAKITKFKSDAYAILEATPTQVQQNQILEGKITRRPSRTTAAKRPEKLNLPVNLPVPTPGSAVYGTLGSSFVSGSLGPSSSHGPQIFLRIRVADTADAVHISTTIPVSAGMYMQEALELVCRKRKLQNPNDYALLLADRSILIPLDRTVASLQGKRELLLIKRSMLPQMGADILKGPGKTTDPNASIFKPIADTPEQQHSSALDYTAAYKKYTIYRKMPMIVTRQERKLAIDGVYIHIMPSANNANRAVAMFDNGRTTSYHIKSIADIGQSSKASAIFKLVLNRGSGSKRYDFEAESPKLAAEIVQTIKTLKTALERSSTVSKSRRSRQIV